MGDDEIERVLKRFNSLRLLGGMVIGAFVAGGGGYLAWGSVAKKAAVDAAIAEVKQQISSAETAHAVEAAELKALRDDIADVKDDVRRVRDVVESWAKPPSVRR